MPSVEDDILGSVDLGGPLPMSSAAPDLPASSMQTQFNKVAGQKQRDLAQLGDNTDQGAPQTTDQPAADSLKPDEGAATPPADLASQADKDMKALAGPAQPAEAKSVAPKPAAPPDWANSVERSIQQKPAAYANAFTPMKDDPRASDPEIAYRTAVGVGRAWNALLDSKAMSQSVASIWNDNSARGKINQAILMGLTGLGPTGGPADPAMKWLGENVLPMALVAGADFNLPLFALSMVGGLPDDPSKAPAGIWNASPPGVIASAISDPKQLTTPEGAGRLFWKYAMASLNTLALLPVARNAVRPFLNPLLLKSFDGAVEAAHIDAPHDINKLPTGDELMTQEVQKAMEIPNVPSQTIAAKAGGNLQDIPAQLNKDTGEVTVNMRAAAQTERAALKQLGLDNWGELPEKGPQMSDEQVQFLKTQGMQWLPHDLVRQMPEDRVAHNFWDQMDQVAPEARNAYRDAAAAATLGLRHIGSGPWAQEANVTDSLIHSTMGTHRTTDWLMGNVFLPAMARLKADAKLDGEALKRAERDPEAYDALSPEGKGVVDMSDLLYRKLRDEGRKVESPMGAVPSFDIRVPKTPEEQVGKLSKQVQKALALRQKSGGGGMLEPQNLSHRAEALTPNPANPEQVLLTEKHPDVFSINRAQEPRQVEQALKLIEGGMPEDQAWAQAAKDFPTYHTNFFTALARDLPQAVKSLHSYQAVDILKNAYTHEGEKLAYQAGEEGVPAGYKAINGASGAYRNTLFHPSFADAASDIGARPLEGGGALKTGLRTIDTLNNVGRAAVMGPAPMIHYMNMLGRQMGLIGAHPGAYADSVLGKVKDATGADQPDAIGRLLREYEAYRAGVVPHLMNSHNMENLYGELGNMSGDAHQFDVPGLRDTDAAAPNLKDGVAGVGKLVGRGYQYQQNWLWDRVAGFGVDGFHIEKAALEHSHPEMAEEAKALYAANRANLWQGRLAPEDWDKYTYTAARLLFFAPNWQRSFYELQAPFYNAKAMAATPELATYQLVNDFRALRGMMLSQFITGNGMNMLLSGHPQWENDAGNTHKIEVTRPEILRAMQAAGQLQDFDLATGRRKSDGAVVTLENPFARQQLQADRPTGFDDASTTTPGMAVDTTQSHTPSEGVAADLAGQVAPAPHMIAAAMNVDLYRSIHDMQLRALNPKEDVGLHFDNLLPTLLTALNAAGMGQLGAQQEVRPNQMSNRQQAAAEQQLPGPLQKQNLPDWATSTIAPLGVREMIAHAPDAVTKGLFNILAGTAAPYIKAPKTAGDSLSDPERMKVNKLTDDYDSAMTTSSNQLTAGQITPQQWLAAYQNAHDSYSKGVAPFYNNAPEYTQGQLGLVNAYLGLSSKPNVHDPVTGAVDYSKLGAEQEKFKATLSPQQLADLSGGLQKNGQAYPALQMYRDVQAAHDKAVAQWAQEQGLSPQQFRATVAQSSKLSGPQQQQFEAQHPELRQYQAFMRQWEQTTWPGHMYGLYYMTPTVQRWLMSNYGGTDAAAQERATLDAEATR